MSHFSVLFLTPAVSPYKEVTLCQTILTKSVCSSYNCSPVGKIVGSSSPCTVTVKWLNEILRENEVGVWPFLNFFMFSIMSSFFQELFRCFVTETFLS